MVGLSEISLVLVPDKDYGIMRVTIKKTKH